MSIKEFNCSFCKSTFEKKVYPSSPTPLFCSRKCQGAAKTEEGNVTKQCIRCSSDFTVPKFFAEDRKYCSRTCSNGAKQDIAQTTSTCEHCNKEFQILRSRKHNQQFCSVTCRSQAKSVASRIHKPCENCGKDLNLIPSHSHRKFCNNECSNNFQKKESQVHLTCEQCNISFTRSKGKHTTASNGDFCGMSCWHQYRSENKANLSKLPRRADGAIIDPKGYILIRSEGVRVFEHRHKMELHLGRPLLPNENVHHLNGDRGDNVITNLELWSKAQPAGQRVIDKLKYADEILATYGHLRKKL